MLNTAALDLALADLEAQTTATEGVEQSATALIQGFSAQITTAVTDALTADNKADDATIAAVQAEIDAVTKRFVASAGTLGAAISAVPGTQPPTP